MKYETLSKEDIKKYEDQLIEQADIFWVSLYGRKEGTNIEKLRLLSNQGRINDKFQHDVMTGYFRKEGFWRDGKTTLEERKKQLILEKQEFGKKIAQIRDSKIKDIDSVIAKAQERKETLSKIPIKLHEEFKINKNEILVKLTRELDLLYETSKEWIDKEISDIYDSFINTIKSKQDSLISKARNDIETLQKQQKARMRSEVENFSSELEAELAVLNHIEDSEDTIKKYEEEIGIINQEINEIESIPEIIEDNIEEIVEKTIEDILIEKEITEEKEDPSVGGLDTLTVAQLKQIADANNISYDARIKKADLIEKLTV